MGFFSSFSFSSFAHAHTHTHARMVLHILCSCTSPPRPARYNVHHDSVTDVKWNRNGNWLLTSSRDSMVKLFDIRVMKDVHTYRAHKKEVNCELARSAWRIVAAH